ncbi:MAG: calcium-binding protein, partial [Bdellovibrionota bacterium]
GLFDRTNGTAESLSVTGNGEEGCFPEFSFYAPALGISADGRFVAFSSEFCNLVPGDTNGTTGLIGVTGAMDIFVRDRLSGKTERVSVAADGSQANDDSTAPAISPNGRYVIFQSRAANLVPSDTNGYEDIFLRDRALGTIERVNLGPNGEQTDHRSFEPKISADGRYIAFQSYATNLVPADTNGYQDIFVRDRFFGTTVRASLAHDGSQTASPSYSLSLSADGRYLAFVSSAANLVPNDTNAVQDVFVRDLLASTTRRVNVTPSGAEALAGSSGVSISADGRYVAFDSYATNLVPGDTNNVADIFVKDMATDALVRVSVSASGQQAAYHCTNPSISADGRYVAFQSQDPILAEGAGDDGVGADALVVFNLLAP